MTSSDLHETPFCIIHLESVAAARKFVSRSILSKGIYELWGAGSTYDELHADVTRRTSYLWQRYRHSSFKFTIESFQGSRTPQQLVDIIESFSYMDFQGPIRMSRPEEDFAVFEEFDHQDSMPQRLFLGRLIAASGRDAASAMSLKMRKYISTTSMDAELALVAANLTLAGPETIAYDPFVGTGSLTLACAHFGASVLGSDIDGRSIRGSQGRNLRQNFEQYGLTPRLLDSFISDLTHSPMRTTHAGWVDAVICDPPYGVREGLKVLGSRDGSEKAPLMIDDIPAHL